MTSPTDIAAMVKRLRRLPIQDNQLLMDTIAMLEALGRENAERAALMQPMFRDIGKLKDENAVQAAEIERLCEGEK